MAQLLSRLIDAEAELRPRRPLGVALRRAVVYAVEDHAAQLTWSDAPRGELRVHVAGAGGTKDVTRWWPGGPGGAVVEGLRPASTYDAVIDAAGERARRRFRTLASPPGPELSRVATISDLHLGESRFGVSSPFRTGTFGADHDAGAEATAAALRELSRFEPDLVVVKGDLTDLGWHEEWRAVTALLATVTQPLAICPGNHDTTEVREVDPAPALAEANLPCADPLDIVDLPGVRVAVVDSATDAHSAGSVARALADLEDALAEAEGPALVCLHHPFEPAPVPGQFPTGIRWPEAPRVLARLRRANSQVLITAGHTHRHRRLRFGPLVHTEVGSVRDYPGVWGGYAIHEGGIRQVVRRTQSRAAMEFTERSRTVVGGVWQFYADGVRAQRCFTHPWPQGALRRRARLAPRRATPAWRPGRDP